MKTALLNITKLILIMTLVSCWGISNAQNQSDLSIENKLKNLESSTEGRLGIYAINTENGHVIEYRSDEAFPMGCTSKVMGVSALLKKSMSDPSLLSTKVKYSKENLENWSPVTEKYVSEGMTIQDLCAASISYSDNTAMNLLLKPLGGVQGINEFARSIGNLSFRQDNDWPLEAYSGGINNLKDSSTPKAMVESLRKLTMGNILDKYQRDLLIAWLIDAKTESARGRIRAGVPNSWTVANKTGTGAKYGSTNDLAIIWPLKHEPLLIGVYYTTNNQNSVKREDVVSAATKLAVEELIKADKQPQ
jgi:beta-lactamase class A